MARCLPPPEHRRTRTRSSQSGAGGDSPSSCVDKSFKDHLSLTELFCGQVTMLSVFVCPGPFLQIPVLQSRRKLLPHLDQGHTTSSRLCLLAPVSLASLVSFHHYYPFPSSF